MESRAFNSPNFGRYIEKSLDFTTRVMTPIQNNDSDSLSFALISLVIASIISWMGFNDNGVKAITHDYPTSLEPLDNEILNMTPFKILNPNRRDFDTNSSSMSALENMILENNMISQSKPQKVTLKDYENALRAYEELMEWSKNETQEKDLLEGILEVAISKTKGRSDPSDNLYRLGMTVFGDLLERAATILDKYIFKYLW